MSYIEGSGELCVSKAISVLGFSTGSPSIDRHLWAVKSGYVPGASFAMESPELVFIYDWLRKFDVGLRGVAAWENVDASPDVVRLQLIVGGVLYGAYTSEAMALRFPCFGTLLHQIIDLDRMVLGGASGPVFFVSSRAVNDELRVTTGFGASPLGGA